MLNDFDFCSYTHFIFGRGAERKAAENIAKDGANTVLILHGPGKHVNANGMLDNVKADLESEGLRWLEFSNIRPNPDISDVRESVALAKRNGVDYILSIGGGSVIDTGKATAAGIGYDGDVWDLFSTHDCKTDPARVPHHAVILTMPATGSESGYGTMIDNRETHVKCGMLGGGNFIRPAFAFMNPELTYSIPIPQTMAGIVDMYAHIFEYYCCNNKGYGVIDHMCEGAMKAIRKYSYVLLKDPTNYEARAEIMYAGSVAHNGTLSVGRLKSVGAHKLAQELTALYDSVHGVTISVMTPAFLRHVYSSDVDRFARYAEEVFDIPRADDPKETALAGIAATEQWYRDIGMPVNFAEAGLPTDQIEQMARKAAKPGARKAPGAFCELDYDDMLAIYKDAAGIA